MPIQLNIHPSRYLLAFILLTHIGAMLLLLALPLQWWAMLLIEICLIGSFIYNVRYYVIRQMPSTIIKVWPDETKVWHLLRRDGEILIAKLMSDSLCSNVVVILNFKITSGVQAHKKCSVLIFPDSVDAINYRRLRAWFNSH